MSKIAVTFYDVKTKMTNKHVVNGKQISYFITIKKICQLFKGGRAEEGK